MAEKKGWWRTQLGRIRDSWNREMGIQPGGGFTWRDFGNLAQSLVTGGLTGVSGRPYDFNTRKPMQGFNPLEGFLNRGRTPPGAPPGPGIAIGQPGRPAPQPTPYPQFTDWNAGQQGPPSDPNYDQIYQGPPEELAGTPRDDRRIRGMRPLTRAQQEAHLEMGRTLGSLQRGQEQAREIMDRMFEGKER